MSSSSIPYSAIPASVHSAASSAMAHELKSDLTGHVNTGAEHSQALNEIGFVSQHGYQFHIFAAGPGDDFQPYLLVDEVKRHARVKTSIPQPQTRELTSDGATFYRAQFILCNIQNLDRIVPLSCSKALFLKLKRQLTEDPTLRTAVTFKLIESAALQTLTEIFSLSFEGKTRLAMPPSLSSSTGPEDSKLRTSKSKISELATHMLSPSVSLVSSAPLVMAHPKQVLKTFKMYKMGTLYLEKFQIDIYRPSEIIHDQPYLLSQNFINQGLFTFYSSEQYLGKPDAYASGHLIAGQGHGTYDAIICSMERIKQIIQFPDQIPIIQGLFSKLLTLLSTDPTLANHFHFPSAKNTTVNYHPSPLTSASSSSSSLFCSDASSAPVIFYPALAEDVMLGSSEDVACLSHSPLPAPGSLTSSALESEDLSWLPHSPLSVPGSPTSSAVESEDLSWLPHSPLSVPGSPTSSAADNTGAFVTLADMLTRREEVRTQPLAEEKYILTADNLEASAYSSSSSSSTTLASYVESGDKAALRGIKRKRSDNQELALVAVARTEVGDAAISPSSAELNMSTLFASGTLSSLSLSRSPKIELPRALQQSEDQTPIPFPDFTGGLSHLTAPATISTSSLIASAVSGPSLAYAEVDLLSELTPTTASSTHVDSVQASRSSRPYPTFFYNERDISSAATPVEATTATELLHSQR